MLTADLVHVRRRADLLSVVPISAVDRPRALELAQTYLDLATAHVDLSRGALLEACRQVHVEPAEQRLAKGLLKLVLDRCEFQEETPIDPVQLRRDLFTLAADRRRALGTTSFDRQAVLSSFAEAHRLTVDDVERALYSDLPDAHRLRGTALPSAERLLRIYGLAQHQAVLLRAVRLRATIFSAAPGCYRQVFRKLKFLRLLYAIERLPKNAGFRLEIDGPYSLFDSVTKYGLQLALALPTIMECDAWKLEAELRWGKERSPLRYHLRGSGFQLGESKPDSSQELAPPEKTPADLPDDVARLLSDLKSLGGPWQPSVADAILDLPGVGVCVPDLQLVHAETGCVVYVEVLGYWSREAVWKRVELVERGLDQHVVFAVSKHLRVSEAVLDQGLPAALYVYARTMNARTVLERVDTVAAL